MFNWFLFVLCNANHLSISLSHLTRTLSILWSSALHCVKDIYITIYKNMIYRYNNCRKKDTFPVYIYLGYIWKDYMSHYFYLMQNQNGSHKFYFFLLLLSIWQTCNLHKWYFIHDFGMGVRLDVDKKLKYAVAEHLEYYCLEQI